LCGIAGIAGDSADETSVKNMVASIKHRGPDSQGFFSESGICLGVCRLAIIDLVSGDQPILNEDGSIVVVFNGEIYNYPELRSELQNLGHRFTSTTDTEVLVHGYEEYQENVVDKLNGMYAFAIYNLKTNKLILARDHAGIKPLYFASTKKGDLAFASEVKGLLQVEGIDPQCDPVGLKRILSLGYIPGDKTMFKGIHKLRPGTVLTYHKGKVKQRSFWNPNISEARSQNISEVIPKLKKILNESISRHMISDVPIGAFLSGGLDTSTVVGLMSKISAKPVQTFTLGFSEPTDEIEDAKKVSEHFGTEHHDMILDPAQLIKELPNLIWHGEAPKINLYPYFISKLAKKHVKVVLSGLGGDELFAGYIYRYKHIQRAESLANSPYYPAIRILGSISNLIPNSLSPRLKRRLEAIKLVKKRGKLFLSTHGLNNLSNFKVAGSKLLNIADGDLFNEYRIFFNSNESFMQQTLRAEFRTKLVDDFLVVDDAMTMAHSLEERVPLLDRKLTEYAFTIPIEMKLRDGVGKYVLRKSVEDLLPKEMFKKAKWGFSLNIKKWYNLAMRDIASQKLLDGFLVKDKYLERSKIKSMMAINPQDLQENQAKFLWVATLTEIWHQIFMK